MSEKTSTHVERCPIVVYAVEYLINNGVFYPGGGGYDLWEHRWVLAGTNPTEAIRFAKDTGGKVYELRERLFWERHPGPNTAADDSTECGGVDTP